jgi:hypothetical protein
MSCSYVTVEQVELFALRGWLAESAVRQWDYTNVVKRRGVLEKLGSWQVVYGSGVRAHVGEKQHFGGCAGG